MRSKASVTDGIDCLQIWSLAQSVAISTGQRKSRRDVWRDHVN